MKRQSISYYQMVVRYPQQNIKSYNSYLSGMVDTSAVEKCVHT